MFSFKMSGMAKFFLKSLLLLCLTVIPVMAVNYVIDPLQCLRMAAWYRPLYDSNERMQNPCLARTQTYDTVIIGTSNVENFDPAYMDGALHAATLKLAMAGSTLREQRRILELAIRTGKTKRVVWGVETALLGDDPDRVRDDIVRFPSHFYDTGWKGTLLYLLDPYLTKHYAKMIANRLFGFNEQYTDLRTLNSWQHLFTFSKERALAFYQAVRETNMQVMDVNTVVTDSPENIRQNILQPIRENPDVQFLIFFPPYSILRFVHLYEQNRFWFDTEFTLKEQLIRELLAMDNAEIFEFQDLDAITFHLDNYKDLTHYSKDINSYLMDSLASGKRRIRPGESPTTSLSRIRTQVENFQLSQVE